MHKRIAAALGVAILLAGGVAHAALVKKDLSTPGDGLVTLDTATGLEWLKLTATQDMSVDQVLGGAGGWVSSGFQYASFGQVGQLLNDAGYLGDIGNYSTLTLVADNVSANTFLVDFGATSPPNFTFGLLAPYECARALGGDTSCTDYVQINANGNGDRGFAIPDSGPFGTSVARSYAGSFLVRAVPEPDACATLLAGLAVVATIARRRRKG